MDKELFNQQRVKIVGVHHIVPELVHNDEDDENFKFSIIIMMGKMTTHNDKLGKQFSGYYTQEFPPHIPISSTPFDFGFEMMMRLPPIQIAMGATMLTVITYCCGENNLLPLVS